MDFGRYIEAIDEVDDSRCVAVAENVEVWSVVQVYVTAGPCTPTACVTLKHNQGFQREETQEGSHEIDAVFKAVNNIVQIPWTKLDKYCFIMLTDTYSQITADVVLIDKRNQKTFSATSVADCNVVAFANAYIIAINQAICANIDATTDDQLMSTINEQH